MTIENRDRFCWKCKFFASYEESVGGVGGPCMRRAPTKLAQLNGNGHSGLGTHVMFQWIDDGTIDFCGKFVPASVAAPSIPEPAPEQ